MSPTRIAAGENGLDHMGDVGLQALQSIESIGEREPLRIVRVSQQDGTVVSPEEMMAAKVKWAETVGYSILTLDVPNTFAPYNAVIRVSERGTEDQRRDYLAQIED